VFLTGLTGLTYYYKRSYKNFEKIWFLLLPPCAFGRFLTTDLADYYGLQAAEDKIVFDGLEDFGYFILVKEDTFLVMILCAEGGVGIF